MVRTIAGWSREASRASARHTWYLPKQQKSRGSRNTNTNTTTTTTNNNNNNVNSNDYDDCSEHYYCCC